MQPSDMVRLQAVNLVGSIQMFGMTTTRLVDGYNGLKIAMRPDTGVITVTLGGVVYALSPSAWTAAQMYDQPTPLIVAEPALTPEPKFENAESASERIPVATIRKRHKQKMADRVTP